MRFPNDTTLGGLFARILEDEKKKGRSVEWIAEEIDYSRHMIYKIADCSDPSSLPLSKLIPFMRATGNYSPLKFIAQHCGFVIVKIPVRGIKNLFQGMTVLQQVLTSTVSALWKFYSGEITLQEVKSKIDEGISHLASTRMACERAAEAQDELDLFRGEGEE